MLLTFSELKQKNKIVICQEGKLYGERIWAIDADQEQKFVCSEMLINFYPQKLIVPPY